MGPISITLTLKLAKTFQGKTTTDSLHKHNVKIVNKTNPAIYKNDNKCINVGFIQEIKVGLMFKNNVIHHITALKEKSLIISVNAKKDEKIQLYS